MDYEIHKGVDKPVEFKGLQSQYLFILCGGLLAVFILFALLYMGGVSQWACIGFGATAAAVLLFLCFRLNARFGRYGLMKLAAARYRPRRIIHRKKIQRLIKHS